MASSKQSRNRRKSSTTMDQQVKHRRTRSGCFTCRTRRVKCDENRPICDRCQKGGRECTFPDLPGPSSKSSSTSGSSKARKDQLVASASATPSIREDSSSPGDFDRDDDSFSMISNPIDPQLLSSKIYGLNEGFKVIQHAPESKNQSTNFGFLHGQQTNSGRPPTLFLKTNSQISPDIHTSYQDEFDQYKYDPNIGMGMEDNSKHWSNLPQDITFFLDYHQQHINHHHYLLKSDNSNFFKNTLVTLAMRNEALLYALVAFSSYHYHVSHRSIQYDSFLEYYNRAVALLRHSLDSNREPDLSMLVTILQIAIFEEYLGDWINLSQHRKGAFMILNSLYSPQSLTMASEDVLTIFEWFTRFDLFVSTMSCTDTVLSRQWYDMHRQSRRNKLVAHPRSSVAVISDAEAHLRFLGMEVANLLSGFCNGSIADYDFETSAFVSDQYLEKFGKELRQSLLNLNIHAVSNNSMFKDSESPQMHYGAQNHVYAGDFWSINYINMEVCALSLMLRSQSEALRTKRSDRNHLNSICATFSGMEAFPDSPIGAMLPTQMSLGMSAAWTSDSSSKFWFRQKFARLEELGFNFPSSYRSQLSLLWGEPEIQSSWVQSIHPPSSNASHDSGVLMSIRNFEGANYRTASYEAINEPSTPSNLFGLMNASAFAPSRSSPTHFQGQ